MDGWDAWLRSKACREMCPCLWAWSRAGHVLRAFVDVLGVPVRGSGRSVHSTRARCLLFGLDAAGSRSGAAAVLLGSGIEAAGLGDGG